MNAVSRQLSPQGAIVVDGTAYRPFAHNLIEIAAQSRVNGTTLDTVLDTGSPITVMRESCWRYVARDVKLVKVPFSVSSCAVDGEMVVHGMCNLQFDFWSQTGVVTVIVVNDASCSNNCLLGLNAVRAWPAMNRVVELMIKERGVSFKQTESGECLDADRSTISSINMLLADSVVKPSQDFKVRANTIRLRSTNVTDQHGNNADNGGHDVEMVDEEQFVKEFVDGETSARLAIDMFDSDNIFLRVNNVQPTQQPQAINQVATAVLKKFPSIVAQPNSVLGQVVGFEHKIELVPGARPFKLPLRTAPFNLKQELKTNMDKLFERGIIIKSKSPFASAIVLVRKKTGELRLCVDYRRLNQLTIKDAWPLPRIDELVAKLGCSSHFTTLDLADGYYQIPLRVEDRCKTAFLTEFGLFEFTVMPFGLTNAPASFQRMMEEVLEPHISKGIAGVYGDDVVVHSQQAESHVEDVLDVCEDINIAALRIKWGKCLFDQEEIEYLGFLIGRGRIVPSQRAAAAIRNFPTPTTVREVQHFLGLTGHFRKHVQHFSKISAPLHEATHGDGSSRKINVRHVTWTAECQQAFETLKRCLSTVKKRGASDGDDVEGCLALPDFSAPFVFTSDACEIGLGAWISQRSGKAERPVAFWSKKLRGSELDYAAGEKELMAIVLGIEHFKQYLYGRHFTVRTDHRPLSWLRDHAKPSCRLARWLIKVRQYDFDIVFISGVDNVVADALSRFFLYDERAAHDQETRAQSSMSSR